MQRLSRLSVYLAIALFGLALSNFGIIFLTTQGHEFLAKLAYWELLAAFSCFVFSAISATVIAVQRNREKNNTPK
jgi:hypothetical protein